MNFKRSMLSRCHVEMLVTGNFDIATAMKFGSEARGILSEGASDFFFLFNEFAQTG